MKLSAARSQAFLASFLAKPDPRIRAVLVYGPDSGLVRERAESLAKAVALDLDDPFRVAALTGPALASDPARLNDEMAALCFTGGRRVLRVREAGDGVGELFEEFLAAPPPGDSLAVVEAGDLAQRSALRRAFEGADNAVAVPCYADSARELADLVKSVLGLHRVQISPEAQHYLVGHLGADRALSRAELEKLALYAGDGGSVTLEDAIASVGDSAALTVEDVVFAAADGDAARVERALARALGEGENAVAVLRAAARHFQRLHLAGSRIAAGARPDDAVRGLRPPVFFKHQERFEAELERWPPPRAATALGLLLEAEGNCKRTGFPAETLCSEALLRLARLAARKRS